MTDRICKNCGYRLKNRCQRHPPQVIETSEGSYSEWPEIGLDDWCGEFKEKSNECET